MSDSEFKSDVIFAEIKERAQEEKDAKKAEGSYRFTVTSDKGNTKSWLVNMNENPPYIGTEKKDKADVELVLKDSDFILIAGGKAKAEQLFMQQKMKIKGNLMKAMKLKTILDPSRLKSKL
ncbi:SCP2 domain-containing protein [Aphelenchoides besseyi]|nr:SCP2 domain-containing protein [Aphelenchoides besseyi]KAI6171948.1 SCP2 domain-containing protein [Aphelenchoides besseyi]